MVKFTKELKEDLTDVLGKFSYSDYSRMMPLATDDPDAFHRHAAEVSDSVMEFYLLIQEVFRAHGFQVANQGMSKCGDLLIRFTFSMNRIQYCITYNIEDGIVDIFWDCDLDSCDKSI